MGQLVEDMETKMRQNLEGLYISKTKAIIFTTRYERSINENKLKQELAHGLRDVCFGDGQ